MDKLVETESWSSPSNVHVISVSEGYSVVSDGTRSSSSSSSTPSPSTSSSRSPFPLQLSTLEFVTSKSGGVGGTDEEDGFSTAAPTVLGLLPF